VWGVFKRTNIASLGHEIPNAVNRINKEGKEKNRFGSTSEKGGGSRLSLLPEGGVTAGKWEEGGEWNTRPRGAKKTSEGFILRKGESVSEEAPWG